MMKRIGTILLIMALTLGSSLADKKDKDKKKDKKDKVKVEKVVLKPDLRPKEIIAPEGGVVFGPNNQVTVIVENLSKDSDFEGKVKVELVVIQDDASDRMSYFAEVEAMGFKTKREAVFTVEAKNKNFVRLLAIVDPDKTLVEENEDNNRRIYKVAVKKAEVLTPSPSPSPAPEE